MERPIIVVSGVQGAGKSTVARRLAERFQRGVHIEADALQRMIVSGGRWVSDVGEPRGEALSQLRLRLRNACLLARSFREAGFTVVVDDIIIGDRLDHLRQDLEGVPFHLVVLAPDIETVIARDAARGVTVGEKWAHYLDAEQRKTMADTGLWIDSSDQTPDATVADILDRLGTEIR